MNDRNNSGRPRKNAERIVFRILHLPSRRSVDLEIDPTTSVVSLINESMRALGTSAGKSYEFGLVVTEHEKVVRPESTTICPACGEFVKASASFCPQCGSSMTQEQTVDAQESVN